LAITAGLWLKSIVIGPTDSDIQIIVFDKTDTDTIIVGFSQEPPVTLGLYYRFWLKPTLILSLSVRGLNRQ
jgi:hypothetical protein